MVARLVAFVSADQPDTNPTTGQTCWRCGAILDDGKTCGRCLGKLDQTTFKSAALAAASHAASADHQARRAIYAKLANGTAAADGRKISMTNNPTTLPPFRYVMSERRISRCQAWEDGCEYEHCPRWREGKIINNAHCALDLIGIDNE